MDAQIFSLGNEPVGGVLRYALAACKYRQSPGNVKAMALLNFTDALCAFGTAFITKSNAEGLQTAVIHGALQPASQLIVGAVIVRQHILCAAQKKLPPAAFVEKQTQIHKIPKSPAGIHSNLPQRPIDGAFYHQLCRVNHLFTLLHVYFKESISILQDFFPVRKEQN